MPLWEDPAASTWMVGGGDRGGARLRSRASRSEPRLGAGETHATSVGRPGLGHRGQPGHWAGLVGCSCGGWAGTVRAHLWGPAPPSEDGPVLTGWQVWAGSPVLMPGSEQNPLPAPAAQAAPPLFYLRAQRASFLLPQLPFPGRAVARICPTNGPAPRPCGFLMPPASATSLLCLHWSSQAPLFLVAARTCSGLVWALARFSK